MENQDCDGIVLLAKTPGLTSFSALYDVKHALNTNKVGHTGTLDSFAQGLLVVCTGKLTKLAGNITQFDKTYSAVIKFGVETDTLEYTGKTIKTAPLPNLQALEKAVKAWTGTVMQKPPVFSAIHVDGKRASDITRSGGIADIPARKINVFSAEIKETKLNEKGFVEYALVDFCVSKGTYIRSLARDIGEHCGSAAHLVGLYRTKIGNFNIENAAGYDLLKQFTIENVILQSNNEQKSEPKVERNSKLQQEIKNRLITLDTETCMLCGFNVVKLADYKSFEDFKHGKKLHSKMFDTDLHSLKKETSSAVFSPDGKFSGLIFNNADGRIEYKFVLN